MREGTQPEVEVLAAALRALASDYERLNWSLFRSALKPVPLVLGEAGGRLGCWYSDPRRIEIARSHVLREPWGLVLETLKHEMAHQFVHEVLKIRDEPPHGPSFQRICERLGIDGRASGLPQAAVEGAPILKRVADLLALAESPNPHEAEVAMRTAHRLMLKHNLERPSGAGAAQRYGFRHLGKPTGRTYEAERALAGLLGEFFFVQPIWVSVFRASDQKRVSILEVTGRHENLAMAEYVHQFLLHAAESLWRAHKSACGIKRNADRRAFQAGVMRGFADKLRAEREQQRGQGLVWIGDPQADGHFKRRHPHVRTTHAGSTAGTAAANHGRVAGQQLVLHRPLEKGTRARGRALPPTAGS